MLITYGIPYTSRRTGLTFGPGNETSSNFAVCCLLVVQEMNRGLDDSLSSQLRESLYY